MKFLFTTISVKNMEESFEFYTEILKLKEERRFSPQRGVNIVFLKDEEGNQVELIENAYEKPSFVNKDNSVVTLCFGVEDLEKSKEFLKNRGIGIKKGPRPLPNGGSFIVIEDPNGVEIGLYEGF